VLLVVAEEHKIFLYIDWLH